MHTEFGKSLVLMKIAANTYTFFVTKESADFLPSDDLDIECTTHLERNSLYVCVRCPNMSISSLGNCITFVVGSGDCSELNFRIRLSSRWWKMFVCENKRLQPIKEVIRINGADSLH
jgi:hypothetical protein